MPAPKKPQDRKPAKAAPDLREFEVGALRLIVDAATLDDFELVDDLARIEDGEYLRAPSVLRRVLGTDQYKQAMDHLRDPETRRVSNQSAADFLGGVFKALSPNS